MYLDCKSAAFTLLELITVIAILSIIVSIALPQYHHFRENQERSQVLPLIRQSIAVAKSNATVYHAQVVICASASMNQCEDNQWHQGWLIFLDLNRNRKLDQNDQLLQKVSSDLHYGQFYWKGGATSKTQIVFQADSGLPRGSSGHFKYCSFRPGMDHFYIPLSDMGHTRLEHRPQCD